MPVRVRQKSKVKSQKFWQGFTLIEFLVVLGLLVLTVGTTLLFLTSVLKGSNQANITAEAKQNGQAVLDSLEGQIRNAIGVVDVDLVNHHQIQLNLQGSTYMEVICVPGVVPTYNGWIGIYSYTSAIPNPPAQTQRSLFTPLTNQDTVGGVDIENCSMKVLSATSGGLSPATVTISFVINQGVAAPTRQDFAANIQMQTTISLRQYLK